TNQTAAFPKSPARTEDRPCLAHDFVAQKRFPGACKNRDESRQSRWNETPARQESRRLSFRFAFQQRTVLDPVKSAFAGNQLLSHPLVQRAADILARNPRHRGDFVLRDFLFDEVPPAAEILPEGFGKAAKRERDAALGGKKTCGGDDTVGVAQSL